MKNKKVTSMFLSCALGFCVLFGYGSTSSAAETQQNTSTEEDNQDDSEASESTAQDDQEAAEQLLTDLKGTYQELWQMNITSCGWMTVQQSWVTTTPKQLLKKCLLW